MKMVASVTLQELMSADDILVAVPRETLQQYLRIYQTNKIGSSTKTNKHQMRSVMEENGVKLGDVRRVAQHRNIQKGIREKPATVERLGN